jgi:DAACS family dicarboxylate/amino acid:cation (Na+ or H+) symporter
MAEANLPPNGQPPPLARRAARAPLYVRVLIGVAAGVAMGVVFKAEPIFAGWRNEDLGQLGMLVIRLLKALAVPLILFAILDAFLHVQISARAGGRLILICLCNVSVAFAIGLTLMNTIQPGHAWRGRLGELAGIVQHENPGLSAPAVEPGKATLDPLKNIAGYVPESLVDPFTKNNVITVVLLGLLGGAALRHVKLRHEAEGNPGAFQPLDASSPASTRRWCKCSTGSCRRCRSRFSAWWHR